MEKRNFTAEYEQLLKDAHEYVENKVRTTGSWIDEGLIVKDNPLSEELALAFEESDGDHNLYLWDGETTSCFSDYFEESDIFAIATKL